MDIYRANKEKFCRRFPAFRDGLSGADIETAAVGRAQDGGVFYAKKTADGKWEALSDPNGPIKAAEEGLRRMENRLLNSLSPAVVVGLRPGYVLDSVYAHFKGRESFNEPFRRIYVVVDSLECLVGWLKAADRGEIVAREEVEFYRLEDIGDIVALCEADEQRSHQFIPVSELPEANVNALIAPLAAFYARRERETLEDRQANNAYYDAMDDKTLAGVIAGEAGRKPRVMLLAHARSQVVQFSARDTAEAFVKLGWDAFILQVEQAVSPWRLTRAVREFRPDIFLMINHLRTENNEHEWLYPKNLLFVSWIQDSMPPVNRRDAAEKWNAAAAEIDPATRAERRRDLIVGYVGQLRDSGYAPERLTRLNMIVNTDLFRPRKLSVAQKETYACELCFASNRSKTTEEIAENELAPLLAPRGFPPALSPAIHDALWRLYRQGQTITAYRELETFLSSLEAFRAIWEGLSPDDRNNTIEAIFWRLNDVIYRHAVLGWCDDLGVDLRLYGQGWEKHPRFGRYARGPIAHGEALSIAYQAARYCLHLNAQEGGHQRLLEIIAAGGAPIYRSDRAKRALSPELSAVFRKLADRFASGDNRLVECRDKERDALFVHLYQTAFFALEKEPELSPGELASKCARSVREQITQRPERLIPGWESARFDTPDELRALLERADGAARRARWVKAAGKAARSVNHLETAAAVRDAILTFSQRGAPTRPPLATMAPNFDIAMDFALAVRGSDIREKNLFANPPRWSSATFPVLRAYLARAAKEGRFEEVVERLLAIDEKALRNPSIKDAFLQSAWELLWPARRYDDLARCFEKAGKIPPPNWRFNRAKLAAALGDMAEAARRIRRLYRDNPTLKDGLVSAAWIYYHPIARYDALARYFREDDKAGRLSPAWRVNYARTLANLGDPKGAKRQIQIAYRKDNALKDAYASVAWTTYWPLKRYGELRKYFQKDDAAGRLSPSWRINYARLLAARDDMPEARRQVASAYESDPELKDAYASVAWSTYWPKGQYDKLSGYFRKDDKAGRLSPAWRVNYAKTLAMADNLTEAKRQVALAYEDDPELKDAYASVAWGRYWPPKEFGELKRWFQWDNAAGRLSPSWRVNYGRTLVANGDIAVAETQLQQAYRENPELTESRAAVLWSYYWPRQEYDKLLKRFREDDAAGRLTPPWRLNYAKTLAMADHMAEAEKQTAMAYDEGDYLQNAYASLGWTRYWPQRDFPKLLEFFHRDDAAGRLSPEWRQNFALALAAAGEIAEAERQLTIPLRETPETLKNGYAALTWSYYWPKRDYDPLVAFFRRDDAAGRLSLEWRRNFALAVAATGDLTEAKRQIAIIYRDDPEIKDRHASLAWNLFWPRKEYEPLLGFFREDDAVGRLSLKWRRNFAMALIAAGDLAEAKRQIAIIYRDDPEIKDRHASLAWNSFWPRKEYGPLLDFFREDDAVGRLSLKWRRNFAMGLIAAGDLAEAKRQIAIVYREDLDLKDVRAALAWNWFWTRNDYAALLDFFREDDAENRLSPIWRRNFALALAVVGEIDAAERQVTAAYREDPNLKNGYAHIGWHYFLPKREYAAARELFRRDDAESRLSPPWRLNFAQLLATIGDAAEAARQTALARENDPTLKSLEEPPSIFADDGREIDPKKFQENCAGFFNEVCNKISEDPLLTVSELETRLATKRPKNAAAATTKTWAELAAMATLMASRYRYDDARALVEKAYRANPVRRDARARLAIHILNPQWLFVESVEWFDADAKEGRLSDELLAEYAFVLAANDRTEEAERAVEKYYNAVKDAKDGYAKLGWGCLYNKLPTEAYGFFRKDYEGGCLSAGNRHNFAVAALFGNNFAGAVRAIEDLNLSAVNVCSIARSLWQAGLYPARDFQKLAGLIEAELHGVADAGKYGRLMECLLLSGDLDAARKRLNDALARIPEKAAWLSVFFALTALTVGYGPEAAATAIEKTDLSALDRDHEFFAAAVLHAGIDKPNDVLQFVDKLYRVRPLAFLHPTRPYRYLWVHLYAAVAQCLGDSELSARCREWRVPFDGRFLEEDKALSMARERGGPREAFAAPRFVMPWELATFDRG